MLKRSFHRFWFGLSAPRNTKVGGRQPKNMEPTRRTLLGGTGVIIAAAVGTWLWSSDSLSSDVAEFEFTHEGFDDAPSWLTIRHTGGEDLPADEVFVTGQADGDGEYVNINGSPSSVGGVMKPWYELDEDIGRENGIAGAEITRTDFQPDVDGPVDSFEVLVVRERDGESEIIGEWLRTYQGYEA